MLQNKRYWLKMKSFWVILSGLIALGLAMIGTTYIYINREDFRVMNPLDQMVSRYWRIDPFSFGGNTGNFFIGYLVALGCLVILGLFFTVLVLIVKTIDEESKK